MTLLAKTRWVTMVTLVAGVTATSSALAGEAIIVPGDKSKAAPSETRAAPREVFRLRDTVSLPFDALMVPMMPEKNKPLDPKEEKRRRLQQIEQKNWMIVGQGELQAEEEEKNFLNVRDYSLDGIEKQDGTGNLMFRPLSKDDTRRIPGQFRSAGDNTRQPARSTTALEEDESQTFSRPEKDPQFGAHMSSELNFRGLFETKQAGGDSLTPKFNKSELTLHSLLNSGGSETAREQQARREEFRNFLNKPANPLAGPSDPINSRDLMGRQPLNPTMPQPLGGNALGSSAGGISRPNSGLGAGLPNFNSGRPGFSAGSFLSPQDPARGAPRPSLNMEPPKRKF